MAAYLQKKDVLVICPYDPAHKVLQSRYQGHIAKCKQNNMNSKLKVCPFNATHLIAESAFREHLVMCKDRSIIDKKMMEHIDNSNEFKGRTAVPAYNSNRIVQHGPSETWDNEIGPIGEAGFTPRDPTATGGLILDLGLTKPAERKKIYQRLNAQDEEKITVVNSAKPSPSQVPNRQPRENHETLLQGRSSFGRGTSVAASSPGSVAPAQPQRIAANIFNERQPKASYQEVMSLNTGLRGIGRGRGRASYEESFPSLGQH